MSGGRVAVLSAHTSPLDLPGTTKAGGMNVYVRELSRQMAEAGWTAEIFTRRTDPSQPDMVPLDEGLQVVHVDAGPAEPLAPADAAAHVAAFAAGADAAAGAHGWSYDLAHSHYWVAGLAGIELARRWGVPHASTFHTLGEVKNRHRLSGAAEAPEPAGRIAAERRVAACADLLISATAEERDFLAEFYGADAARTRVVAGGVDASRFHAGGRATARERVRRALPALDAAEGDGPVILFAGRLEPMKGADLLIEAFGMLDSALGARLWIVGGGARDAAERNRLEQIARASGAADRVVFQGAVPHEALADVYRAADICAVPSTSESFGMGRGGGDGVRHAGGGDRRGRAARDGAARRDGLARVAADGRRVRAAAARAGGGSGAAGAVRVGRRGGDAALRMAAGGAGDGRGIRRAAARGGAAGAMPRGGRGAGGSDRIVSGNAEPRRALIVMAHPDDIEFTCGGTAAKLSDEGWEVAFCLVTSGDKGTKDEEIPASELAALREAEQEGAARELGVSRCIFLRVPDGFVEDGPELRGRLVEVVREVRPSC